MEDIDKKLDELKNMTEKVAVEIKDNQVEEILEIGEKSQNNAVYEPKMSQEQANAVMNIAKDTDAFIGVKLSQRANELIETDDTIKEEFTALAKDTVKQSIQTFDTKNKKQSKKNFYELNERDVVSLGGDKSSSKGQQFSIVLIKKFFWILFMSVLGLFFIAPSSVIIELFQGISFKNIEKQEVSKGDDKKVVWVVNRHKLGKTGTVIGWIVSVLYWLATGFLIAKFPFVFLTISAVVFVTLLFINICFSINFKKVFRKFNREETISGNIEVEEVED